MEQTVRVPSRHRWAAACAAMVLAACGGGDPETASSNRAQPMSAAAAAPVGSTITYYTSRVIDFGLGSSGTVNKRGINAAGQVAGSAPHPIYGGRAFFFDGNSTVDVSGNSADVVSSTAVALSANGRVTGQQASFTTGQTPYAWTQGGSVSAIRVFNAVTTALNNQGLVVGRSGSGAFVWTPSTDVRDFSAGYLRFDDVNNVGSIVGTARDATAGFRAVIYNGVDGVFPLWTGAGASYGREITDSGWAAFYVGGTQSNSGGAPYAWNGGTVHNVNAALVAAGLTHQSIVDLGEGGHFLGTASSAGGASQGYLWTTSGLVLLQPFASDSGFMAPAAVNRHGVVVGAASPAFTDRAVAWTPAGQLVDLLPRVIDLPSTAQLFRAQAVSDNGHIVVTSDRGLMLLTPVEPGTPIPPMLGSIAANDPASVGATINASVSLRDANPDDTHTAQWDWGDGATSAGTVTVSGGEGSVTGSHAYTQPGIYRVTVTVTDSGGLTASASRNVVVFDPNGGSVAGSGWIESPVGAYAFDFSASGRADFAFLSKYQKGANVPTGNTQFRFNAGNLVFRSDSYEWLVVAGARGQYKGEGTLNGIAGYKFMLTGIDGDKIGRGTPDRFRLKIYLVDATTGQEVTLYDNQRGSTVEGTDDEGTALGGGSIVIKKD